MTHNQPTHGKVLLHGKGVGGFTEEDVERRARELASLDRHPNDTAFIEKYLALARRELSGEDLPPATDEADETRIAITRDPSEPVADPGHRVRDVEDPDGQTNLEHLAEEGIEEAQHEQMLAARKLARREDKKI